MKRSLVTLSMLLGSLTAWQVHAAVAENACQLLNNSCWQVHDTNGDTFSLEVGRVQSKSKRKYEFVDGAVPSPHMGPISLSGECKVLNTLGDLREDGVNPWQARANLYGQLMVNNGQQTFIVVGNSDTVIIPSQPAVPVVCGSLVR